MNQSKPTQQAARSAKANFIPIDEAQNYDYNGHIFRYVYGYDSNHQRSSEAIYCKEKQSDGSYVDKGLVARGTYQYAYDTQGRLISKSVDYGSANNNYGIYSYFVQVSYQADGKALYVKSVKSDNASSDYNLSEVWSYYPDGQLAMYTEEGSGNLQYYSLTEQGYVKEAGILKGVDTSDFTLNKVICRTAEGELNDSTIAYHGPITGASQDDVRGKTKVRSYKYSPKGLLLEVKLYGGGGDGRKEVYDYDDLGRIVSWKTYYSAEDDSDAGVVVPTAARSMSEYENSDTEVATEPEWETEPSSYQTWTYLDNTTVWGVGNPWHDEFLLDGPATEVLVVEGDYTARNTLVWTAPGKLKSYVYKAEGLVDETETQNIDVDADGHIVKNVWVDKTTSGNARETTETTTYTWDGDQLASAHCEKVSVYTPSEGTPMTSKRLYDYTYTFGDNYYSCLEKETNEYSNGYSYTLDPVTVTITHEGNTLRCVRKSDNEDKPHITVVDVQGENLTFTLPNIFKDVEGFTADIPIVASQKGRVLCADTYLGYGFGENSDITKTGLLYFNTLSDNYCSIEHDGETTLGRDIYGRPLFILEGKQLQTIYYYDEYTYPSDAIVPTRSLNTTIPVGQAYDMVTFSYDDAGQLIGQQLVMVDADGTRSETINLEYKYNASGIGELEMDAKVGVNLQGRLLCLKDGATFSVITQGGATLADGVTDYTFSTPGIYLIKVGKQVVKVNVK